MKTLLFIGDSITDSHRLFLDTPYSLGDGYVSVIYSRLPHNCFTVINRGHDGFTSADLLRCLKRDCLDLAPDIITILIGVNDIAAQIYGQIDRIPLKFEEIYKEILSQIRLSLPHAELILMEPFVFSRPEEYLLFHPLVRQESKVIKTLAASYHSLFLPLHDRMNSRNDALGGSPFTLDGIHLSQKGCQFLADLWLEAAASLLTPD
ncbi:MAG: SGNH/GDSL hydrolase family protein [Ruminococcus sp.]|jgi:lysophospholipase L1-like esterase